MKSRSSDVMVVISMGALPHPVAVVVFIFVFGFGCGTGFSAFPN